ncbi:pyocin knob domain-containing protein [Enterobacter vonholyi]|uniref:pyocin knob domain-containing protein n=1 Tax=Enterobacter vonholyi TaxID=2797505 RepID=UPI002666E537|nr:hypothetical protein [Enterobacter vonholyi]MDO2449787.1 hypothetical protein [Enterobacter vonholyi]
MILGFGNNVVSSLASDITSGQTSIPVFPGDGPLFAALLTSDFSNNSTELKTYAKITLTDSGETAFEVCHLLSVSGDTLTVVRGQEGTAAKGWSLKDVVANFATRGSENAFTQIAHVQSGFYTSGTAGGTANALTLNLPTTFFLNGSADWVLKTPIVVYPSQNNTGPATLQLTMGGRVLGTFKLYKGDKAELIANDILKDVALVCLLDNTKTFFTILNPGGIYSSFVPVTRKVNGHQLTNDVDVTSQDIFNGQAVQIGNAADLNSYTTPGLYYQPSNAQAQAGFNYPETVAGSLEVYKHAGVTQVYRIYADSRSYIRIYYNGAWTPWAKQYDSANKPTPSDIGAVSANGGDYNATFKLGRVETLPTESNMSALYNVRAGDGGVVSGVEFNWHGHKFTVGITRDGSSGTNGLVFQHNGYTRLRIDKDGNLISSGAFSAGDKVVAGAGVYDTPGVRVYSSNNPPDLSAYAATSWVMSYFIQGMRLGAQGGANNNNSGWAMAPNGAVLTASYQDANYTAVYYRYPQYNINGTWYNTGAI